MCDISWWQPSTPFHNFPLNYVKWTQRLLSDSLAYVYSPTCIHLYILVHMYVHSCVHTNSILNRMSICIQDFWRRLSLLMTTDVVISASPISCCSAVYSLEIDRPIASSTRSKRSVISIFTTEYDTPSSSTPHLLYYALHYSTTTNTIYQINKYKQYRLVVGVNLFIFLLLPAGFRNPQHLSIKQILNHVPVNKHAMGVMCVCVLMYFQNFVHVCLYVHISRDMPIRTYNSFY